MVYYLESTVLLFTSAEHRPLVLVMVLLDIWIWLNPESMDGDLGAAGYREGRACPNLASRPLGLRCQVIGYHFI